MRVARNFWKENDENCHYLALYMIYDVTTMQLPKVCFELPKIRTILEQCKNNESRFSFWDQGKFHQIVKISQWNNIYLWNFKKAINFYQSDEKKILDTHQDVNGNVFFEKNLQDWAKIFRNGRSCSDVDVAGPSIPTQSEWIDSEEDDSRDNFDLLTSSAAPFVGEKKLCPLDIWLENWFSRTEWKNNTNLYKFNFIWIYFSIQKQWVRWRGPCDWRWTIPSTGKWLSFKDEKYVQNHKINLHRRKKNFRLLPHLQYSNKPANSVWNVKM